MSKKEMMQQLILRCRNSPEYFVENFCKVKHPKAGIIPFNLFSYQRHSLKAFKEYRFNIYKKTRQCFSGESRVWTPTGPHRIDSLKAGDLIYSLDESTGSLVVVPVGKVFDNGIQVCVEVRSKSGHRSNSTLDHQFLTYSGYKDANKLTKDDVLVEINDYSRYGIKANQSEIILLAYFLTDGYCGNKVRHFTNTRWKYLLEFQKHFQLRFGERLKIKPHRNSGFGCENAYREYSYNKECAEWLRSLGILGFTKAKKQIPECVFSWDNESIAILINRMFAADGWYSCGSGNTNEAGIGQISLTILHQLKQLLSRFNISSKIYEENTSSITKLRIIGGPDFERFNKNIGIFGKIPRKPITKGFIFDRIKGSVKSVKPIGKKRVYDLSVPPHHNYVIDGVVVHNCGISTLTGAFALWYAMFFSHKTVLIVSKRDDDAMAFLDKNVKFVYSHLPQEFRDLYGNPPTTFNEHMIRFPNGSLIKSLTSSKDTLRSHSSSLNIIDESGFMPDMDAMWSGGYSTLMHGGHVIVVSTTNGMGNWYHLAWDDAIAHRNEFNPIEVNWWDMDWSIEYKDEFTGQKCRIAPRDNIKECNNKEDKDRWGKYYSPWLEEQYRQLQQRGEAHLFRQEVLAEFIGTGNTVLPVNVLIDMRNKIDDNYARVAQVDYTHPISSEEMVLDFEDQLWIWNKPVKPTPPVLENGRIIKPAEPGHSYVMGVDISSGEDNDYSAIEIVDCVTMEQVAELNIKVMPAILKLMVDYLAKYYNMAYVVPERTGLGSGVSQDIYHELGYPNVYRMRSPSGALNKKVGFPTVPAYKPQLTKCLLDHLTEDGLYIKSRRLYGQLAIFIHYGNNRVGNVKGSGNHDDLPMSLALALIGIKESAQSDQRDLFPQRYVPTEDPAMSANPTKIAELANSGGLNCLLPVIYGSEITIINTPEEQLRRFTNQLGGTIIKRPNAVSRIKHNLNP
jgi:hypothetical protein